MDYSESTKIVFQRIQKHDPENVSKLMGYLLFKDQGELEMIRLAFGPEYVIQTLIEQLKREVGLSAKPAGSSQASTSQATRPVSKLPTKFTPFVPAASRPPAPLPASPAPVPVSPAPLPASPSPLPVSPAPFPVSPLPFVANNGQWIPQIPNGQLMPNVQYFPVAYVNPAFGGYVFPNQPQFVPFEDQFGPLNLAGAYAPAPSYSPELAMLQMPNQRAPNAPHACPNIPELNGQICDNFRKGYCKYGGDCKYLHVIQMENGSFMVLNPPTMDEKRCSNSTLPHGSLKELEMDIIDLLKSRRGIPVTIYSLPILYFDRYGKVLQLDPYLAEARKHATLSGGLPEFLALMSKCFCVIDRPIGMQSIILEDDIPRYLKFVEERKEDDPTVTCSHQVYLTFPPHSAFGEQDLHNYFSHFGPVQEIRIPVQEKRMYGFVTFVYPETAALVLSKSNPHFICGAQVLVKPYQHKRPSLFLDRKMEEKVRSPTYNNLILPNAELHPPSMSEPCVNMALLKKEIKENEQQVDYKMKGILTIDIGASLSHNGTSPGHASSSSSFQEAFPSGCSTSQVTFNPINTGNDSDLNSYDGLDLPDSPFSF